MTGVIYFLRERVFRVDFGNAKQYRLELAETSKRGIERVCKKTEV